MIQEIYNRLTTDQTFAEELKKFVENREIESAADEAALLVEFAKSQGYDITLEGLKAFADAQCKALNEEELDSVNAAGLASMVADAIVIKKSGGLCLGVGIGWGQSSGFGYTMCYIVGEGLGAAWEKSDWYETAMTKMR